MLISLVLSGILLFAKLTSFADTAITSEFVWIDLGNVPVIGSITITLGILLDDISTINACYCNAYKFPRSSFLC